MSELQEVGRGVGGFLGPKLSCSPTASLVPHRRSDFSQIVLRALTTGAFVSLVNACVAGECWSSGLRILTPCFLASLRQGWPLSQASNYFLPQGSSMCPEGSRWTVCLF